MPQQVKEMDGELFGSFEEVLDTYWNEYPSPYGDNDRLRKLKAWGKMTGWNRFFKVLNVANNLFGFATNIYTFIDSVQNEKADEEFRNFVKDSFNRLEGKIDGVVQKVEDGFEGLKDYIDGKAVMDLVDQINTARANLRLRHEQYRTPERDPFVQQSHREAFHDLCKHQDGRPVILFMSLYSVACSKCNLWPDHESEDVIGVYIDRVKAMSLEDESTRIGAFRHLIGGFIISSIFETMFYHAVCVYTMELTCNSESEWWQRTMNRMKEGMAESVQNLLEREKELWDSSMPSVAPSIAPTPRTTKKAPPPSLNPDKFQAWFCGWTKLC